MRTHSRIYLDNAATSFPKPAGAYEAVDRYNRESGVAVGRGAYQLAIAAQAAVDRCRKRIAELLGAESTNRIVFTFNGTDSLNVALHGVLEPGDHVVTSAVEHNSTLRPLNEMKRRLGIQVVYVPADREGRIDPAAVQAAVTPKTKLVAMVHASNVTGTIQPIEDVGTIARAAGAMFLVDAAQSAGHLPINLARLPIDLLACPGHKGLLGPLGTGILYVRPGIEERLHSLRQGGTGTNSEDERQPAAMPEKYEAGNHNTPGLVGLEAAAEYIQQRGIESIRSHERELTARLLEGLTGKKGVTLYGTASADDRAAVVSLNVAGFDPQILATLLDENFGIQTRAGLHCAPGAHTCLGTLDVGGTVRFSSGPFTTIDEIDHAIAAVREIAAAG